MPPPGPPGLWVPSDMAAPQHCSKPLRRLNLPNTLQVGHEANHIATPVAGREVGPPTAPQIDFEGAEPPIRTGRVQGNPF